MDKCMIQIQDSISAKIVVFNIDKKPAKHKSDAKMDIFLKNLEMKILESSTHSRALRKKEILSRWKRMLIYLNFWSEYLSSMLRSLKRYIRRDNLIGWTINARKWRNGRNQKISNKPLDSNISKCCFRNTKKGFQTQDSTEKLSSKLYLNIYWKKFVRIRKSLKPID